MANTSRIFLIFLFLIGLSFVGCLDEDTNILETVNIDEKRSLVAISQEDDSDDISPEINFKKNKKIFQATDEWKTIEPDEMIPPGLHVRMNLQSGLREAKLLAEEKFHNNDGDEELRSVMQADIEDSLLELDTKKQEVDVIGSKNSGDSVKDKKFSQAELKRVLQKFQDEKQNEPQQDLNKDLRNIEEIRKEFKDLNVDIKLDSEILTELLSRYSKSDLPETEKLDILDSFEYYLHQIDNANLFVDAGGLSLLVRDMNGSSENLQSSSLLVLAACSQSNPHSQVAALKEGLMELCLRLAISTTSHEVRGRSIHALSTILRNFPFAQKKFGDLGGFVYITNLLRDGSADGKTIVKVVSLVTDLLEEKIFTEKDEYLNKENKMEKIRQYENVQLVDRIKGTEWCQLLPQFLAFEDLNTIEKILNAMSMWFDSCQHQFFSALPKLVNLEKQLKNQEGIHEQHEFLGELVASVREMSHKIRNKTEL